MSVGLVPSRDGNRIQITGEREPGKLLASGLQQIKKFLSQCGGVSNEANNDELATGVLQYHLAKNNYRFDALQTNCFGINIKL